MRVLKKSVKFTALLTAMVMTVPVMTQSAYGQHAKQNYNVDLNKTNIIRLPRAASAVLIGNPDIADISVHSAKTLFIVGRGYGETNLIVLDRNGHEVLDTNITVTNNLSSHNVRLYNASERQTYSCLPNCLPSPVLGDTPEFIGENSNTEPPLESTAAVSEPGPSSAQSGQLAGAGAASSSVAAPQEQTFTPSPAPSRSFGSGN